MISEAQWDEMDRAIAALKQRLADSQAREQRLQEALRIARGYVLAKQQSEKEAEKYGPMPSWYRAQTNYDLSIIDAALAASGGETPTENPGGSDVAFTDPDPSRRCG